MRHEWDGIPDDEISGSNSEPLTTADLAASRARLGIGRKSISTPQSEPVVVASRTTIAAGATTAARIERTADNEAAGPLLPGDEARDFPARWEKIQVGFVDEPRRAVEQADHLVAETMQRLAETFAKERQNLERQWDRGGDVSTEDLRLALRRYRAFFGRLIQI
jgi:hypothetical protein